MTGQPGAWMWVKMPVILSLSSRSVCCHGAPAIARQQEENSIRFSRQWVLILEGQPQKDIRQMIFEALAERIRKHLSLCFTFPFRPLHGPHSKKSICRIGIWQDEQDGEDRRQACVYTQICWWIPKKDEPVTRYWIRPHGMRADCCEEEPDLLNSHLQGLHTWKWYLRIRCAGNGPRSIRHAVSMMSAA
ncbi:hypothetical protein DL98DRAFT_575823 [Cadophora sp. DSE1049]|nr:hypothetical protein DL98DRAFT_575823 [Cadophora sp. DSE1049]